MEKVEPLQWPFSGRARYRLGYGKSRLNTTLIMAVCLETTSTATSSSRDKRSVGLGPLYFPGGSPQTPGLASLEVAYMYRDDP